MLNSHHDKYKTEGKNLRRNDRNPRRPTSKRYAKYGWAMRIFENIENRTKEVKNIGATTSKQEKS